MQAKSDTIAEIMTLNPTAGAAFLAEFNNDDLRSYLRRLRESRMKPRDDSSCRDAETTSRPPRHAATCAAT